MLSSKAKYAVRAMTFLARRAGTGSWAQAPEIAEQEDIPRKFLELILVQLRDHALVESRRGAQGGYRLLRDPGSTSVADVIRIVDGPLAPTPCASRTRFRPCGDCVDIETCRLQPLMQQARDAIAGVLEHCSLAQLAGQQATGAKRAAHGRGERAKPEPARHPAAHAAHRDAMAHGSQPPAKRATVRRTGDDSPAAQTPSRKARLAAISASAPPAAPPRRGRSR